MEGTLYAIFKNIEESVEQIKRSSFTDANSINNLIQLAQNMLANIKGSEKEAGDNARKRKRAPNSPNDAIAPEKKKAKIDHPLVPYQPRSPYAIYEEEMREVMLIETGHLAAWQSTKKLRQQNWTNMTTAEQQVYRQKHDLDRKRYVRECRKFIAKGGRMREMGDFGKEFSDSSDEDDNNNKPIHPKKPDTKKPANIKPPKRAQNAWIFFSLDPQQINGMSVAERKKVLPERWKNLSDEEKKPYEQQAVLDKERYNREMKEYEAQMNAPEQIESEEDEEESESRSEDEEYVNRPKLLPVRDPNRPQRAITQYMWYFNEHNKLSPDDPDFPMASKLVAQNWPHVSYEEKQRYERLAAQDKERYEREMKEYEAKQAQEREAQEKQAQNNNVNETGVAKKKQRGHKVTKRGAKIEQEAAAQALVEKDDEEEEEGKPKRRSLRKKK